MDRSVRQSVDSVRRGVHGPGVSVFESPHAICISNCWKQKLSKIVKDGSLPQKILKTTADAVKRS